MIHNARGFTIVELLITIVVIGILAAVSVTAYTGIQNRASDSVVQTDINQMYKLGSISAIQGTTSVDDAYTADGRQRIIDYLNANFKPSISSYDAVQYPLVAFFERDYYTRTEVYNIGAVSRSGKVFMVTYEIGGVSRKIANWTDIKSYAQDNIDYTLGLMNDPDYTSWCDAGCRAGVDSDLANYRARLQAAIEGESRGADIWEIELSTASWCYTYAPIGMSSSAFLYDYAARTWVSPYIDGCSSGS